MHLVDQHLTIKTTNPSVITGGFFCVHISTYMMDAGERIFTEIIVLHEAIHSVKIDYNDDELMPDELCQLINRWRTRIDTLTDKLHALDKY